MIKTIRAALASLGLLATGSVAAIMLTGVLEGISAVPRWAAVAIGMGFLLGAAALAGRVAVDVAGPRAHRAAAVTGLLVAALAGLSAVATESADAEGLELTTMFLIAAVVGGAVSVGVAAALATDHRRAEKS